MSAIRRARPADLDAVRTLLSARDGRSWTTEQTAWLMMDLEPERCLAFLAWDGDRPIAVSTLFLRELSSGEKAVRAGYWANLFIEPDYRDRMVYPRLPTAMFAGAKEAGLEVIYAPVRQADLARAHTRIGMVDIGRLPVLIKPLRPFRLLAKHRELARVVVAAATPPDTLYRAWLRLRRATRRGSGDAGHAESSFSIAPEILDLLTASRASCVRQVWTEAAFRHRFSQTREGTGYHITAARRDGDLLAAIIYRIAERGEGIRVVVVMDLVGAETAPDAARELLLDAERDADRAGCEAVICLDGLGPAVHDVLAGLSYRRSPEIYTMVAWPKSFFTAATPFADLPRWRFGFADHDAF